MGWRSVSGRVGRRVDVHCWKQRLWRKRWRDWWSDCDVVGVEDEEEGGIGGAEREKAQECQGAEWKTRNRTRGKKISGEHNRYTDSRSPLIVICKLAKFKTGGYAQS